MEIFAEMYPVITCILEILLEFYFFSKYIDKRVKGIRLLLFPIAGFLLLACTSLPFFWEILVYLLLLISYGYFSTRKNVTNAILYAVITIEIMLLWYGFSNAFTSLFMELYFLNSEVMGLVFMVMGGVVAFLGAYLCYRFLYNQIACLKMRENQYVLMILIPVIMIFLASVYINRSVYGNTINISDGSRVPYEKHLQILTIQGMGIISLLCIMRTYKKLVDSFQMNMRISLLEQERRFQEQYVREARERYEATRSVRHDIKNHLSIVHGLLEKGEAEKAQQYLQGIETLSEGLSFSCHTSNLVLDVLIGNKLGLAKEKGIRVSCSLQVPVPCMITDTDFCIILSNALDNAINACENAGNIPEKQIQVTGKRQEDIILIEIRNSFNGNVSYKKGIGISNITAAAERYHGAVEVSCAGNEFCLSVLLINSLHKEDISQHMD